MANIKQMYKTIMDDDFPDEMTISFGDQTLRYRKKAWKIPDEKSGELVEKGLRYGENPDQQAAFYELVGGNLTLGECAYIEPGNGLVSAITEEEMLQAGKHPGKTNLTDLDNALNILKFLVNGPAAAIMKHNNPSGVAYGDSIADAYERANTADRIAAYGGCLVVNRAMDKATANMVSENYLEVVAAPDFEEGTVGILAQRKNLRIIKVPGMDTLARFCNTRFVDFKCLIDGSIIVQQSPVNRIRTKGHFLPAEAVYKGKKYEIQRQPTDQEVRDMIFGWCVEQGITSNSVIYVRDGVTVGIGTGEQDRVGVAEIAVHKARIKHADALCFKRHGCSYAALMKRASTSHLDEGHLEEINHETMISGAGLPGSVMVSDAFFPFADGIEVGINAGITAVIQPGGSENDYDVIKACNQADVAMVFTGQRAFKH